SSPSTAGCGRTERTPCRTGTSRDSMTKRGHDQPGLGDPNKTPECGPRRLAGGPHRPTTCPGAMTLGTAARAETPSGDGAASAPSPAPTPQTLGGADEADVI